MLYYYYFIASPDKSMLDKLNAMYSLFIFECVDIVIFVGLFVASVGANICTLTLGSVVGHIVGILIG